MELKSIKIDTLLNKITRKDKLFLGDYTVDPYSNCEFGCIYCDSSLDKNIYVKINAAEIIEKELKENKKGRIIVGSVHDPYQNAEKKYFLTRKILEKISKYDFSCHILTKSELVLRDIDILSKIKDCIVTISIISLDDYISNIFEKNAPTSQKRIEIVEKLNSNRIKSGIAIMPVLPFIVDEDLEKIVKSSKEHNAQYILHKYLELKGDQKNIFINILKKFYPNLIKKYNELYDSSYKPSEYYIFKLNKKMNKLSNNYNF